MLVTPILTLLIGLILGSAGTYILIKKNNDNNATKEQELSSQFQKISTELFQKNTESFLTLANEKLQSQTQTQTQLQNKELDSKKGLIDQTLIQIKKEMENVQKTVS